MSNKHPRPADGVPGKTTKDGKPKPWTIKEFCEVISWGGVCGAEEGVNVSSYSSFMKKRGTMGGCEGGTYRLVPWRLHFSKETRANRANNATAEQTSFSRRKGSGRGSLRQMRGGNVRKSK